MEEATRIFWLVVEAGIKTVVPNYIKNILRLFGYYSAPTMEKFKLNQVASLEKFVREDMFLFINTDGSSDGPDWTILNKKDFYFVFINDVQKFKIIDGHRDLIMLIVEFIKETSKTEGMQFFANLPGSRPAISDARGKNAVRNKASSKPESKPQPISKTADIEINKRGSELLKKLKTSVKNKKISLEVS